MSKITQEVYLKSPAYPNTYPINKKCECSFQTNSTNDVMILTNLDLIMEMVNSEECADWLLVDARSPNRGHNVLCGESAWEGTAAKKLHLYFHSDNYDNKSQVFQYNSIRPLRGFFLHLQG